MDTRTDRTKAKKTNQPPGEKKVPRRGPAKRAGREQAKRVEQAERGRGKAEGEAALDVSPEETALCFAQAKPEIDAMRPAAELGRITVTIPAAVTIVLGALPNIEELYDEIHETMPKFDLGRAGRLRAYAYAAVHAHYRVMLLAEGEARLRDLVAEASPLRERLLRSAELHAHYGVFDAEVVAGIRRGSGHLDTANDLAQLVLLFRASNDALAGRTPVTEADLERAATLSAQLLDALGRRRLGTDRASGPSEAEQDRVKAFWLLHGVYEECRRAVAHLRWYEGDADQLTPSLFVGHRRRSSSTSAPPSDEGGAAGDPSDPSESD
jgi:hypothetical protein